MPTTNSLFSAPEADRLQALYADLQREYRRYGEHNACSVIATAMLLELSFDEAHKKLYRLGRVARRGFNMGSLYNSELRHRLSDKHWIKQPNGSQYTVRTIPDALPVGKYFVHTDGHVLALIHGTVYDWTANRKHRVKYILELDSMLDFL